MICHRVVNIYHTILYTFKIRFYYKSAIVHYIHIDSYNSYNMLQPDNDLLSNMTNLSMWSSSHSDSHTPNDIRAGLSTSMEAKALVPLL